MTIPTPERSCFSPHCAVAREPARRPQPLRPPEYHGPGRQITRNGTNMLFATGTSLTSSSDKLPTEASIPTPIRQGSSAVDATQKNDSMTLDVTRTTNAWKKERKPNGKEGAGRS
jgi:hypothetical protein